MNLKPEIKKLYDDGVQIHHSVLLSTSRNQEEVDPLIKFLEPACRSGCSPKHIPVGTEGCSFHRHLFFARDDRALAELGRLLHDLDEWLDSVPGGFLPNILRPEHCSLADCNLARWAAIVYYVAFKRNAPYLEAEIEYQEDAHRVGFFPWKTCPQPAGCRPDEWLIHRASGAGGVNLAKRGFAAEDKRFPDIIDAYLQSDFLTSSLAAIDILLYVMHGEHKRRKMDLANDAKKPAKPKRRAEKTVKEQENVERFLLFFHNPWTNSDEEENVEEPLSWRQIAAHLGWKGSDGAVQHRVHLSMERIFGKNPMKNYSDALFHAVHVRQPPQGVSLLHYAITDPDR